jgi:WD40 repeat protein
MFPPVPPPEEPKPRQPRHTAPRLNVKQAKTNVCLVIAITMMAIVLLSLVLVGAIIFGVLRMPATSDGEPPPALPRIQRQTTTTQMAAGAITLETLDEVAQVQEIREGKLATIAHAPSEPLLAIGMGQAIWLYDQQTMDMVYTLQGHTEDINTLVFAPQRNEDGELLLAASAVDDPYVLLWDVDRGQVVGELEGHNGWIRSLAWSNDGSMIATAATDRTIKLWDVDTLDLLYTLEGHTDMVSDVAFSSDNRMLVSTSRDGSVRLWDTRNGSERMISKGEGEGEGESERVFFNILSDTAPDNAASSVTPLWTTGVEVSPDGAQVAVGATDNIVRILSTADGSVVHRLEGHAGLIVIQGIAYNPDGTLLASASVDGTVRLWDTQTGKLTKTLDHRGGQVLGIAWYPDGQSLVSISDTRGEVIVWDVAAGVPALRLPLAQGPLLSLAYSPDGKILGTSGSNGTVRLHIFDDGQKVTLSDAAQSYQAIGFLTNTSIALATQSATPSEAGEVAIMNLLRQSDPQRIGDIPGAALSVATDPGNALLAIGSSTGEIVLWDGLSNEQVATLRGADSSITRLAFGDGGALLASSTGGGLAATTNNTGRAIVTVWDVAQGEQLYQLMDKPGGDDGVILTGLAMQPMGTLVAATSEHGELIIWDAADGSELHRIEATETQGWFSCVTYSPDGSLLVTGSPDGSMAFWDSRTMELAHTLEVGGGGVLAVTFRPDGQQLAVSVFNGGVRVFGHE